MGCIEVRRGRCNDQRKDADVHKVTEWLAVAPAISPSQIRTLQKPNTPSQFAFEDCSQIGPIRSCTDYLYARTICEVQRTSRMEYVKIALAGMRITKHVLLEHGASPTRGTGCVIIVNNLICLGLFRLHNKL